MRWILGAIILLAVAVLFVAMARTWRTRVRAQSRTVPASPAPAGLGTARASWDGLFVATTRADAPLERIVTDGWGFRGRGGIAVHDEGVLLRLAGAPDRFMAWNAIRGADRATWAIDRVVESGGLIRLRWTASGPEGAVDLDTYFRFPQGDAAVLAALQGTTTTSSPDPVDRTASGDGGEREA